MIRVAVPDFESAEALSIIVGQSPMPVIADVHFDYRLAIQALQNGADGLRINPGNIGPRWKVEAVIKEARDQMCLSELACQCRFAGAGDPE